MKTKGWKNVFAFTFIQQVKSKSFIIGTIVITLLVALLAVAADLLPLLLLESKLDDMIDIAGKGETLTITKVYLCNKTGYDLDMRDTISALGAESEVIGADAVQSKLDALVSSTAQEAVSVISFDAESGFSIDTSYAGNCELIRSGDSSALNSALAAQTKAQYLLNFGVPETELPYAMGEVRTTSNKAGEAPHSVIKDVVGTIVPMLSSIILFMFIFIYSQYVAQAIAIEKSSRIMEYLLTSIKPLALIIGKVLAMCCVSLMQFLIIILGGVLGFVITLPFGIVTKLSGLTQTISETAAAGGAVTDAQTILNDVIDAFSGFDISAILVMMVVFILGFLFFALIAGLAGASISKMEDLASALQPMSILGVVGFYLAYFPQISAVDGEENIMMVIARFVPISSPFVLPSDYMLGKIDIVTVLIAIALLIAADVLMALLVAKVYEHIVLHTGKKLSIKDMLNMANNK